MAPVPRPPIVCYDLQVNENPRRPIDSILHPYDSTNSANYHHYHHYHHHQQHHHNNYHRNPLSGHPSSTTNTTRNKPKVTVIQRDPNELRQQLKLEAKEYERRAEYKRKQLEQLDKVSAQLESAKQIQDNLLKTFGMSHNTARYIQKQDEDFAALRRKVDQFAVTRSKEISQRVQQLKLLHELQKNQDKKAEEKRLAYLDPRFTPLDTSCTDYSATATTNTTNSNSTISNATRNTTKSMATACTRPSFSSQGSSSTISLSSTCSSSNTSIDDTHISRIDFAEPTLLRNNNITSGSSSGNVSGSCFKSNVSRAQRKSVSTKAINTSHNPPPPPPHPPQLRTPTPTHHHHSVHKNSKPTNKAFSFYKGKPSAKDETLEVLDMEFFEKVEDKTMMEVNDLVQKLKAEIECFENF